MGGSQINKLWHGGHARMMIVICYALYGWEITSANRALHLHLHPLLQACPVKNMQTGCQHVA